MAKMQAARKAGQDQAFVRRMVAYMREEFGAFGDRVPLGELVKVGVRIYRKGYHNGQSAAYYQYVMKARKSA